MSAPEDRKAFVARLREHEAARLAKVSGHRAELTKARDRREDKGWAGRDPRATGRRFAA